jgi:hypothetical protein
MPTENANSLREEERYAERTAMIQATVHTAALDHYAAMLKAWHVERFVSVRDLRRWA